MRAIARQLYPQRGTMIGTPAIFTATFGGGRVISESPVCNHKGWGRVSAVRFAGPKTRPRTLIENEQPHAADCTQMLRLVAYVAKIPPTERPQDQQPT